MEQENENTLLRTGDDVVPRNPGVPGFEYATSS